MVDPSVEAFHLCSLTRARLTPLLSSANCPSWQSLQKAVLAHQERKAESNPINLASLDGLPKPLKAWVFLFCCWWGIFKFLFQFFLFVFVVVVLFVVLSFAIFALCFLLLQFKEATMKKLSGSRFMSPCHHPLWLYNKKGTCGPFWAAPCNPSKEGNPGCWPYLVSGKAHRARAPWRAYVWCIEHNEVTNGTQCFKKKEQMPYKW